MPIFKLSDPVKQVVQIGVLAAIYFITARFCLALESINGVAAFIWFPAGISIAALVLYGKPLWLGVFIGDLAVSLSINAAIPTALTTASGNTLHALIGFALLQKLRFHPAMERLRDVVALVGGAGVFGALVSATIGATAFHLDGSIRPGEFGHTWTVWWIGDMISDLIVVPLILTWSVKSRHQPRVSRLEVLGLVLLMAVVCILTFDLLEPNMNRVFTRAYTIFPLMFWIAFRFGPRGASLASFLVGTLAVLGTSQGVGPFYEKTVLESFRHLQVFLATVSVTGMAVAAVMSERRVLEEKLNFLSEAGRIFGSSADFQTKLTSIAKMCVPFLSDWCLVDIVTESQTVHRISCVTANREREDLAREVQATFPVDINTPRGIHQIIRSGTPVLISDFTDAMLSMGARDAEHFRLIRAVGIRSAMIIPLKARGRTLGAITFLSAESDRRFSQEDFAFVQELERRTSGALDSAKLLSEAQTANRAKDDFLAALSHELRTPLNVILGWVQVLKNEVMSDRARGHALDTLERNAQIQVKLINDLLDVSRIVAGKFQLEKRPLNLKALAATTLESLRMSAKAKGIDLQFHCEPFVGYVLGDSLRLQQVIGNLITNAIKFTPPGGTVRLDIERDHDHLKMVVSDTGQGIDPQFLPYVFEAFRQEEGGASRAHGGLGLGLSIVRHITQLHGGMVVAKSEGRNSGSQFTVRIPLLTGKNLAPRLQKEEGGQPAAKTDQERPLTGTHVLLVDDSPDLLLLISHWLQHAGAEVSIAKSASEALDVLKSAKPDVILSDIGMPGEDGYQLIQKIRALPAEEGGAIPAAAITAYAREEEEQKALAAGFQLHIPKPVVGKTLVEAVLQLRGLAVRLSSPINNGQDPWSADHPSACS